MAPPSQELEPPANPGRFNVFFDVWQQAGRFEGRAAVTTWLLSIARFKALSARRRRTDAAGRPIPTPKPGPLT